MNIIFENMESVAFRYGSENEPSWFKYFIECRVIRFTYGYCIINYCGDKIKVMIGEWIIKTNSGLIKVMSNEDFKLEFL